MAYKQTKYFSILKVSFICVCLSIITVCGAKETVMGTCKNLDKVDDIDDLLFQFYSNIDNQCLFEMPTEELEKIWGIRVLDYVDLSFEEKSQLNVEFKNIKRNEEGIFIAKENYEQSIPAFHIHLADKYRKKNNGWGGSVGKGQYPKLLPSPEIVSDFFQDSSESRRQIHGSWSIIPKDTVYHKYSQYYWLNKANSDKQPVLLFETNFLPRPARMILYSEAQILDFK